MMNDFKVKIYFPPHRATVERLEYERNAFAEQSRRRAEHDAQVLRDYEDAIAALKAAQNGVEDVSSRKNAEIGLYARSGGISQDTGGDV